MIRALLTCFILVTACVTELPTLAEISGEEYSTSVEFVERVGCQPTFTTFMDFISTSISTEQEVLELAATAVSWSDRTVEQALRAGDVWVLVDSEGFAFAAMEVQGATTSGCAE
jgi:hypothetical protein